MTYIIDEYLDFLNEAKKRSRATITKKTKIKRAQSTMSTAMARKRNDPMYRLMKKYCDTCKGYRDKVHKKYATRTISRARK